jgi:hypothetical protein
MTEEDELFSEALAKEGKQKIKNFLKRFNIQEMVYGEGEIKENLAAKLYDTEDAKYGIFCIKANSINKYRIVFKLFDSIINDNTILLQFDIPCSKCKSGDYPETCIYTKFCQIVKKIFNTQMKR